MGRISSYQKYVPHRYHYCISEFLRFHDLMLLNPLLEMMLRDSGRTALDRFLLNRVKFTAQKKVKYGHSCYHYKYRNVNKQCELFRNDQTQFGMLINISILNVTAQPWRWRRYAPPNRWYLPTKPHDVTTQASSPPWKSQISRSI
jgi:hypothetical protein